MCLDADDYCPHEAAGKLWRCLDCGKVWETTPWLTDIMKRCDLDPLYCKECRGELEEIQ